MARLCSACALSIQLPGLAACTVYVQAWGVRIIPPVGWQPVLSHGGRALHWVKGR
jgi:hypothetical protein